MNIKVIEYNPVWEKLYKQEADNIRKILGELLIEIYHIGSTAVVGLKAKPIIDIMPVVRDIDSVDLHNLDFEKLGYECMDEFGIPKRRYFRKGGDERTHQIHIFEQNNQKDINRHLAVRDFLKTHSDVAAEYGELKINLAMKYPNDIEAYCDGKDAFVKLMEEKALKWYKGLSESY